MTDNFLENPKIIMVISFIWGIGLALLFMKTCPNNCIVLKVPSEFNKNNKIFGNGKCYNLHAYQHKCVDE
jgi:hypothetical protein